MNTYNAKGLQIMLACNFSFPGKKLCLSSVYLGRGGGGRAGDGLVEERPARVGHSLHQERVPWVQLWATKVQLH